MIDGIVEKPLYLAHVEIHGQDSGCAGFFNKISDQFGRDRRPWGHLSILPCVAIVGHNHVDSRG